MNKLKEKLARFMYGRYGSDRLNIFMVIVLLVCAVINLFVRTGYFSVLLTSWEFLLLILIYFRMFSRKVNKRFAENYKYLSIKNKFTGFFKKKAQRIKQSKTHRFYKCPGCKTVVRVPKGKGKIKITCPKCGHQFIKRT